MIAISKLTGHQVKAAATRYERERKAEEFRRSTGVALWEFLGYTDPDGSTLGEAVKLISSMH